MKHIKNIQKPCIDVGTLQERLNELGYYDALMNGYFGVATEQALEDFQAMNDLVIDGKAGIKAWLCAIARHNSLDRVRKQRSLSVSSLDDPNIPEIEDDFSLEGEFIEKAERKRVLDAVKALGEPDREIIIRKYYLGQSSKTIAQRLDMTVSNVDVRTHRAVARLKDSIGGE